MTFVRADEALTDEAQGEVWRRGRSNVSRQSSYITRSVVERGTLGGSSQVAIEPDRAAQPLSSIHSCSQGVLQVRAQVHH